MTGEDLQRLLQEKWGFSYAMQLRKINKKIYLQVMWPYLEQVSFPLSESQYQAELAEIAQYLTAWGVVEQVTTEIHNSRYRPRTGKAISIALELGDRTSEWII